MAKYLYKYNSKVSELQNVIRFCSRAVKQLENMFRSISFLELLNSQKISNELFLSAMGDCFFKAELEFKTLERTCNKFPNSFIIQKAHRTIKEIGFTDDALKLKLTVINNLFSKLKNSKDFFTLRIISKVMDFLRFLNNLFASLTKLFPQLDPVKEIKELAESVIMGKYQILYF